MRDLSLRKLCLYTVFTVVFLLISGCSNSEAPVSEEWTWPERMHIAAPGRSGLAKYVSWASVLEADTGMTVRVVPESDHGIAMNNVKSGKMLISSGSQSILRSMIEVESEYISAVGGVFQPAILWVHDLANSGFIVRGDSDIKSIRDIREGTRFSVWSTRESALNPYLSLLAWIELDEKNIKWVNAGSYEGAMRAVAEGRADVAFGFPSSPLLAELAGAPHGIRFLDLNSSEDPEGARRWQSRSPLYSFGPIETGIKEARGRWGSVGYIFDICSINADVELIYHLAKWLDLNFEDYEDKYGTNRFMSRDHLMEALNSTFLPVHPGLVRYLKELELWTEAHEARQKENIALVERYKGAYNEAADLAEKEGIEISPLSGEWISLWENYKAEARIPRIGMHPSLTESAFPVYPESHGR